MKNSIYFEFAGLKGKQGGLVQYATTWSLSAAVRLLAPCVEKLVNYSNEEFDRKFIGSIATNLLDPHVSLSYSPVVVAASGTIQFVEDNEYSTCGTIKLPVSADLQIIDGAHRIAGLMEANLPTRDLERSSLPILLLDNPTENQLLCAREYFLNHHREIGAIRSKRSTESKVLREMTKDLLKYSRFLKQAVDVESCSLAPRSRKLLTITGLTKGSTPIFHILACRKIENPTPRVAEYWEHLSNALKPWYSYKCNQASAPEIRESTILSSATIISALGRLGAYVFEINLDSWKSSLDGLSGIDWSKGPCSIWEGRALKNGQLSMGKEAESLSYNLLKQICGYALESDEVTLEEKFKKSQESRGAKP